MLIRLFLMVAIFLCIPPSVAQSQFSNFSSPPNASDILASTDSNAMNSLNRDQQLEVMKAQVELADSAYSRLEILIGTFGVVIAVVAIVFGISTRETAIAEAAKGVKAEREELKSLAEAANRDVQRRIDDITAAQNLLVHQTDEILERIKSAALESERVLSDQGTRIGNWLNEAEAALRRIKEHEIEAARTLGQIAMKAASNEPLSEVEADKLNIAASDARAKPVNERNLRDTIALIASAADRGAWEEALELAHGLANSDNQVARCTSLYHAAMAWFHLGNSEKSLAGFEQVISEFPGNNDPSIRYQYYKASLNRGIMLSKLGKHEEAIQHLEALIDEIPVQADSRLIQVVGRARNGLAYALDEVGRTREAIKVLSRVIGDHRATPDSALRIVTHTAAYNRACAHSKMLEFKMAGQSLVLALELGMPLTREMLWSDSELAGFLNSDHAPAFFAELSSMHAGALSSQLEISENP